jgi:hypothetical protein
LVVEIDGPIHQYSPEQDTLREQLLTSLGLRVLRFTNEQVRGSLDAVIEETATVLGDATPRPVSPCGHNPSPCSPPRARVVDTGFASMGEPGDGGGAGDRRSPE